MGFIYSTKSLECLFCICLETPDEIDKIVFLTYQMSFILDQMQRPSCGQWISFSLVFKLLPIFNFTTNLSQENLQ